MAHYAFVDENNIVVEVIPGRNENEVVDGISDWETYYTTKRPGLRAIRTSYNTIRGQHTGGGTPFRGNYAGIGFCYNEELDIFIAPKTYDSWIFYEETASWEAPVPYPDDAGENEEEGTRTYYEWDEEIVDWVQFIIQKPERTAR